MRRPQILKQSKTANLDNLSSSILDPVAYSLRGQRVRGAAEVAGTGPTYPRPPQAYLRGTLSREPWHDYRADSAAP